MLDDLERKLHFYRESIVEVADAETSRNPLALPGGVSPESADALSALLSQKPDTVLIDGYNVVGAVSESLIGSRLGRDDVVARAEAVKRRVPETEVIVVFDAAQSGGSGGFRSGWGVLVEFEPKTTADDAIVELVHGGIDQCVVITNDRELQDRSARPGCVVVFSTALISWTEHLNGKSN
jgi:predicted RNA-binding protein with PIN domain